MTEDKNWPQQGDRLVHRFIDEERQVVAEVIFVDRQTGRVTVRIGEKTYASLSAAARAIAGHPTNGWIFWGLKKQAYRPRIRSTKKHGPVAL